MPANKSGHHFHSSILREYDVRGIIGKTLSREDAYYLGKSFGTFVLNRSHTASRIAVGYDGRLSSPELEDALVKGLQETGFEVLRIGLGPTPMLYFSIRTLAADAGIMITGSHNPPDYNGFKMALNREAVFGDDIRALGTIAAEGAFAVGAGKVTTTSVLDSYLDVLLKAYEGKKKLKIAWDAGNGATGEVVKRLAEKLPGEHILLNETIDGNFPSHHPDPTVPENLEQLIETVIKNGCDIGIAFDGDGDRIGAVDDKGRIIWGDQLMMFFAADVLELEPGATIIADVKASQALFDEIARLGGVPLMWKTGHSLIKAKMLETGAPLAGEMSGHMFFADRYFGFDDGIYSAVRLLSIVAKSDVPFSAMRDRLPVTFNTPEIRLDCDEERKFAIIDEVKGQLKKAGAEFADIDGVRVKMPHGWWLLRASNTQAVLVARCEADNEDHLFEIKQDLNRYLAMSGLKAA